MAEPEPTTESWTYIGRRVNRGKLIAVYLDPNGLAIAVSLRIRGTVIGGKYEATVIRADDGRATIRGRPLFIANGDSDDRPTWAAEDRAALTADDLRKRENAAAKNDGFGDLTLREAAHLYERLPAPQGTALVAQILRYLDRGRTA